MKILGISGLHHDSAACVVDDGIIVAAAEEERFSRKRDDRAFPVASIAYCLEEAAVESATEIDIIVFHEKPAMVFDRIVQSVTQGSLLKATGRLKALAPEWGLNRSGSRLMVEETVRQLLPEFNGEMLYSPHHVSHAASAFFPSPFCDAAILTIDGVGEWVTATIGHGKGSDLSILRELKFPNSIGLFYKKFAQYIGLSGNSSENRMMVLAATGEPSYYDRLRSEVIRILEDGSVEINEDYLRVKSSGQIATRKLINLLGRGPRDPNNPVRNFDRDLAASVQRLVEDAVLAMARFAWSLTGSKNLCLAGGVALNCVANGELRREGDFRELWVQPASGVAGGALGAALATSHLYLNQPRALFEVDAMRGATLGPSYTSAEILEYLDRFELPRTMLDRSEVAGTVAQLVADGNIVGLLQGGMEFGPRALGNRSILGDPRLEETKTRINLKVKNRDASYPCESSVLAERVSEWFELDGPSNYMCISGGVSRSEIPGTAHVDGSARPQTVQEGVHPGLHAILRAFEQITGVPVLINVAFCASGEPLVCSPIDAYRCMMRTGLDCIVMEDVLVWRHEQNAYDEGHETVVV